MSGRAHSAAGVQLQVRTVLSPLQGESADGLLARVAAAECATRMFDFTKMAGASFPHHAALSRQEPEGVRLVAKCIGADPEDLAQRCTVRSVETRDIEFFGLTLDPKHVAGGVRRFAPASLLASAHHRALWMLKPFPFCEESWQFLVEHCPNRHCGAVQRWRWTNGIDICDRCGEQLTRADAEEVPAHLRENLRHAVGLFHPDQARRAASRALLPEELADADAGALMDLLCAIAGVADPSIRYATNRRVIDERADRGAVTAAVATAWSAMVGWPAAFERLIGDKLSAREGRFGDGNDGATLAFLDLPTRSKMRPIARRAISRLCERLEGNDEAGYRAIDAASRLGIAVSELTAARRRGELPTVFHLGSNPRRARPLIGRAAIDALIGQAQMPHFNVNLLLGASPRTVDILLARGLLEGATFRANNKGARITRASIDAFVARLQAASRTLDGDTIPLRAAMRIVGGRFKPWADALAAMLGGSIEFAYDSTAASLIDGIRIREMAVGLLLDLPGADGAEVPFRTMLSKADAIDVLNLHPRDGVSVLGAWKGCRGDAGKVPTSEILALAKAHITPAEAALRLSIRTNKVRHLMEECGIRKMSGAGYDRAAFEAVIGASLGVRRLIAADR